MGNSQARTATVTVVVSERGVREISLPGLTTGPTDPLARSNRRSRASSTVVRGPPSRLRASSSTWTASRGFRRTVLERSRDVGWGETVTYGELAAFAGRPRAARAAGSAMRNNPLPFVIPCHRVVAAVAHRRLRRRPQRRRPQAHPPRPGEGVTDLR